ncbi:hypothetical protein QAD02_000750 [Eretmocerus hayati]|uniref:Uncharacterized protein n=1 Tax=Eretmocerus hayati TaxID=131215 RepID=A0ACC2NFQ4_9HYME|nr:hypothetical protein QAD02_000750 [Eretmocerus hayati]
MGLYNLDGADQDGVGKMRPSDLLFEKGRKLVARNKKMVEDLGGMDLKSTFPNYHEQIIEELKETVVGISIIEMATRGLQQIPWLDEGYYPVIYRKVMSNLTTADLVALGKV